MAATARMSYASGAGPILATGETGMKFNREESLAGDTTPVPKPIVTGTNYSWPKVFRLEVTGADAGVAISNRRIHRASAPVAGMTLWYRDDGASYVRSTAVAAADNGSSDDAAPAGYSALPGTAAVFDAASVTANAGGNGDYLSIAVGVSNLYVGGAGSAIALPNIVLTYDEA